MTACEHPNYPAVIKLRIALVPHMQYMLQTAISSGGGVLTLQQLATKDKRDSSSRGCSASDHILYWGRLKS